MSRFIGRALLAVSFVTAVGSPCWAGHVRGIKASLTSVNPATRTANINVTMYTDGPATVASTTIGSSVYAKNGISWGDGVVVATAHLPQVAVGPLGVFRGAFVHTYPDNTTRTIHVATDCCVGYVGAGNTINVGNPVIGYTGVNGVYDAVVTNSLVVILATPTPTATPTATPTVSPTATVPPTPTVPTVPPTGLGILGLVLLLMGSVLVLSRQPKRCTAGGEAMKRTIRGGMMVLLVALAASTYTAGSASAAHARRCVKGRIVSLSASSVTIQTPRGQLTYSISPQTATVSRQGDAVTATVGNMARIIARGDGSVITLRVLN